MNSTCSRRKYTVYQNTAKTECNQNYVYLQENYRVPITITKRGYDRRLYFYKEIMDSTIQVT